MKMKLTFLLLVSVFFVSCGMPTLFNLRTEEYSFKSIDSLTDAISGSFEITTTDTNISTLQEHNTIGPSLMFFYTISDSNDSLHSFLTIKDALINAFSTKIKKEPFGVNNPIYHELVFTTSDDTTVSLYEFNRINNQNFTLPYLILTGDSSTVVPKLDSFTLNAKPTFDGSSQYYIQLNVVTDIPSGSFTPRTVDLYGFEGSPFFTLQYDISNSKSGEYAYLPIGASDIYLNIFSAFSVTGDFTNIFWSTLTSLGQIELPLP